MKIFTLPENIRGRLVLISILPAVVVAIVVSAVGLSTSYNQLNNALIQSGDSTAAYIAATAELPMYAADRSALEQLGQSALATPEVVSIGFFGRDNQLLAVAGASELLTGDFSQACIASNSWSSEQLWFFCKPVLENLIDFSDYTSMAKTLTESLPEQYGWVVLVISREGLLAQQYDVIQLVVLVALLIVLISALIALWIGRGVSRPVMSLENTVKLLEKGQFDVRAEIYGPLETQVLAKGINSLAGSVAQSQQQLELKVEKATRQLTDTLKTLKGKNTDLEFTQQELQEAMKIKDQFMARMSHELRTPLTAVTGFSRLLQQTRLQPDQVEYIENIVAASSLLLDTIDGILGFSKLQSGKTSLENIDYDLRESMERLISMHAYQAHSKSLELVLMLENDVPTALRGDPTCIMQVVNNLLINAIKFTDQGEVILHITVLGKCPDNAILMIQVRDTGIGISQSNLQRLFQPFSQADDSITRRFGGTGLGLVICKQLVELMQGEITVDSEEECGTCVKLTIPVNINTSKVEAQRTAFCAKQLNILVYDANGWTRKAISEQLKPWLENVTAAHSDEQMIDLLAANQQFYDLLILGLSGGGMSAEYLSTQLSAIRANYAGPVLLLAEIRALNSRIPAAISDKYAPLFRLSKPVRQQTLLAFLQNMMGAAVSPKVLSKAVIQHLAGLHILVAEDNHFNRRLLQSLLELLGATVAVAVNGDEAVECFKQGHFDVVLMDVHMPVMDGITATRMIVDVAGNDGILIFGLTANVMENERDALLAAGAVDILYKPLNEALLVQSICECLGRDISEIAQSTTSPVDSIVSQQLLYDEFNRLMALVNVSVVENRLEQAGEYMHELLGLSGFYSMVEVRELASDLNLAINLQQHKEIQRLLEKLQAEIVALQ